MTGGALSWHTVEPCSIVETIYSNLRLPGVTSEYGAYKLATKLCMAPKQEK